MSSSSDALFRRRRRLSSLGIALSLLVHTLVLGALFFGVRKGFEAESTPVADVQLIPAWPTSLHREPRPPRKARVTSSRPQFELAPPTRPVASAEPSLAQPILTQAPDRPLPPPLRLGLGCAHADFMRLTAEERAACRDRFASTSPADHDYADAAIDPKARATFDAGVEREKVLQTPFLSAMPKKGCRPRATEHDAAAFGKSQPDFTIEATCVVHF